MFDATISHTPAKFTTDEKGNRFFSETEDGFKRGGRVKVDLPGDLWHGRAFTISNIRTERTVDVTNGPEQRYYCIGALRHC